MLYLIECDPHAPASSFFTSRSSLTAPLRGRKNRRWLKPLSYFQFSSPSWLLERPPAISLIDISVSLWAGESEGAPGRCVCGKLLKRDAPKHRRGSSQQRASSNGLWRFLCRVAYRSRRLSGVQTGFSRPHWLDTPGLFSLVSPRTSRHASSIPGASCCVWTIFLLWNLERGRVTVQVQIRGHIQVLKSPSLKWQHLQAANRPGNSPQMESLLFSSVWS